MSALEERVWWDSLHGDEILHNTAGNPPYNVDVIAGLLERVLALPVDLVLDLGCGPGRLTRRLAERNPGSFFFGVDIAPSFVDAANTDAPRNMEATVGDGRTIPGVGTVHAAYSVTLFQHLPHDAVVGYIAEVRRVLVDGGRFAFTWAEGDEDTFLSHPTTEETVKGWLRDAGFDEAVCFDRSVPMAGWRWAWAR